MNYFYSIALIICSYTLTCYTGEIPSQDTVVAFLRALQNKEKNDIDVIYSELMQLLPGGYAGKLNQQEKQKHANASAIISTKSSRIDDLEKVIRHLQIDQ